MKRLVVLNTRPPEQAAELSALLRAAGCKPVEAPATRIEPAWIPAELSRARKILRRGDYAWLVLQSANAARWLPFEHVNILCGAATARALGIDVTHTLERFSARAALQTLLPLLRRDDRVLVPRADGGRTELIDGLRAAGFAVDAPIAYRTVPANLSYLTHERVDVVTLCSPSAVHAVTAALNANWLAERRVVCLGETTAQAAREHGLRVDAVAEQTSMRSLVDAVVSLAEVPV
jgi:uroporphyrinogen-III synthase